MYNEPNKFDLMMGTILSSIDVKYPTKLPETKRVLLDTMHMVYCHLKDCIHGYDPTHQDIRENEAIAKLRNNRKRWAGKIQELGKANEPLEPPAGESK